jgi:PhzF family phenazine biosynthesis protein
MAVPIYVVDSFTSTLFTGNPAGVCLLEKAADARWMQKVAAEMKHAETAFLSPRAGDFDLRWFTPTTEVDLCGHATLAAAHILWETDRIPEDSPADFHTKSGVLSCTRHGYGIQMDFPSEPPRLENLDEEATILSALGLTGHAKLAGKNRMDVLIVAQDEGILRGTTPDMEAVCSLGGRGVIVTAKSDSPDFDFVSRFFAPAAGVPEDPVTGSAHCCLGPYWAGILGKSDLAGFQCSERGGTVRVAVRGDRVLLQGTAITTLRGELLA